MVWFAGVDCLTARAAPSIAANSLMERARGVFSGILRHRGKRSVSPIALLAVQDKSLPLVTSVSGRVDDYALTGMQANWHIRF
jgi:hypothetical protein